MDGNCEEKNLRAAIEDLRFRTLAGIHGDIAKLIYLASTRDYNTGQYCHDGLAFRFTSGAAERALEIAHQEIFERLVFSPLETLTNEVEAFMRGTHNALEQVLKTWKRLEPYRVAIPQNFDRRCADLFFSNIRIALAILEEQATPLSAN